MGDRYRELMDGLIRKNVSDGKLDLKGLLFDTENLAQRLLKTPEYVDEYETRRINKEVAPLMGMVMGKLSTATREVLGLIPKDQWNHDADGEGIIKQLFHEPYEPISRLIPLRGGKIFKPDQPGDYNANKPLKDQAFEFVTVEYLVDHQKTCSQNNHDKNEAHHGLSNAKPKASARAHH